MFSERAMEKLRNRKTPPATFNLDLNLVGGFQFEFKCQMLEYLNIGEPDLQEVACTLSTPDTVSLQLGFPKFEFNPPPVTPGWQLLVGRPQVPPHPPGVHLLRHARGAGHRGGGGARQHVVGVCVCVHVNV